jgi:hypothetical protein
MSITIKSVHITEMHEKTWGRVYVQYEQDNEEYFILKNWLFFDEKTYKSIGSLLVDETIEENGIRPHHVYLWFPSEKRHVFQNYQDVLNGAADDLYLTTPNYKEKYGTPSVILKRLLIELRANIGEPLAYRSGWYQRYQTPEIILSPIVISENNKIYLSLYENLEIKLEPLIKLVYLLFLNHPEGIVLVNIGDYEKELSDIYSKITKSDDLAKIQRRVSELTNLTGNSLHEKISKIKNNFVDELGEKLAKNYYIYGNPGEAYKINLSPTLIKKL